MSENKNCNSNLLSPKVKLEIYLDGKKVFEKEDDMLVRNFNRVMGIVLSEQSTTVKSEDGITFTPHKTMASPLPRGFLMINWSKIAVGTDNTEPTFEDFKLGNKYSETSSLIITPYYEEGNMLRVDMIGNFTINENITLYEFGLFYALNHAGTLRHVLFSRDVVSDGISITAGQVISVVYRWIIGI